MKVRINIASVKKMWILLWNSSFQHIFIIAGAVIIYCLVAPNFTSSFKNFYHILIIAGLAIGLLLILGSRSSHFLSKIGSIDFVDLYISEDFCEMTGLAGVAERTPAPAIFNNDIDYLRTACQKHFSTLKEEEFSLKIDNTVFYVTVYQDVLGKNIFTLRRSAARIRKLTELGFSTAVSEMLLAKDLRGLVLIAGERTSGKTSTALSLIAERLRQYGGLVIAIEDPPGTGLNGMYGKGWYCQLPVSRRSCKETSALARCTDANVIFVGEIRDGDTAIEALQASINGHLVISTIHARSPSQAVERLQTFCLGKAPDISSILAEGLSVVIWQNLEKIVFSPPPVLNKASRLRYQCVRYDQSGVKTV
jgi:twitching motility protein PilT